MEVVLENVEKIIIAAGLIANFVIALSKNNSKWFKPKIEVLVKEVQKNRKFSLLSLIYSEAPILSRMYALLEYIKLGFNHEAIEWSANDFIIHNQQLWWTAVNETKDEEIKDAENYKDCMNRIKQLLQENKIN